MLVYENLLIVYNYVSIRIRAKFLSSDKGEELTFLYYYLL
jgi:hypothetical protein